MTVKTRNWSLIIYPDRTYDDWIERLDRICISNGIKAAISPLHDRDVWTYLDEKENENHMAGYPKPEHYHVILRYPGPTTQKHIETLTASLNGIVEPITGAGSLASMYAYLTHQYQPTKAQYNEDDIMLLNGWDMLDVKCAMTKTERVEVFTHICNIIRDECIDNMIALINHLERSGLDVELAYLEAYTGKIVPMLNAQRKRNESQNYF